jgi:hypothetical protein
MGTPGTQEYDMRKQFEAMTKTQREAFLKLGREFSKIGGMNKFSKPAVGMPGYRPATGEVITEAYTATGKPSGRPKVGTDIDLNMRLDKFKEQIGNTSSRLEEKAREAGLTVEKAFDTMEPELKRGFNSLEHVLNVLGDWEKKLVRINADATVPAKPGQGLAGGSVSKIKLDAAKQALEGDFIKARTAFNVLQTTVRELSATIAGENTQIQTAKRAEAAARNAKELGKKEMAHAFEAVVQQRLPGKEFRAARQEAAGIYKELSPRDRTLLAKNAGFVPGGLPLRLRVD